MTKYSRESLEKLILLIDQISSDPENNWFKDELSKKYNDLIRDATFVNSEKIKTFLSISPELSIDYSFINHPEMRNRLERDNLIMERYRLENKELGEINETERFYYFIIYAFHQIENSLNYLFHQLFTFDEIVGYLIKLTANDRYPYKKSATASHVGDIVIAHKIRLFLELYSDNFDKYFSNRLTSIRKIRNISLHRCTIIKRDKTEDEYLHKFLNFNTYETVRNDLKNLMNVVSLKLK